MNMQGVTGDHCEKCDVQNHYFGNPINESCYYDLAIDYQFTFNLSKPEDKHYTAINFKNIPTKADVDVDFQISCNIPAKMNLTFRSGKGNSITKEMILTEKNCTVFKHRFSKVKHLVSSLSKLLIFFLLAVRQSFLSFLNCCSLLAFY